MDKIKESVTRVSRPNGDTSPTAKKTKDSIVKYPEVVARRDLLSKGAKRNVSDVLRQENSSSLARPSSDTAAHTLTKRNPRKKVKESLLSPEELPRGRTSEKLRISSLQVLKKNGKKDLVPHVNSIVVVATYDGGEMKDISLGTEKDLVQAGVPEAVLGYLLQDHEADYLVAECRAVCLHALLYGFIPALESPLDAKKILQTLSASKAKDAADMIVVRLSCESSAVFLDFFLSIWKNPNASDIDMITVPALTVAVQQNRLAVARVLLRHGADPLLDRVNVADKLETVLSPWERVFFRHSAPGSLRFGSQEMEDLLRLAILSSGRQPPRYIDE